MRRWSTAFVVLLCVAAAARAQNKLLTIDDIYDPEHRVNFSGTPPMGIRWLKNGDYYLQNKVDPQTHLPQLRRVNAVSGEAAPFYDAAKMEAAFAKLGGFSQEEAKRLAHRPNYLTNGSETAVLINHDNDLFYYEFGSDRAVRLTNSPEAEEGEEFSPDGRLVS